MQYVFLFTGLEDQGFEMLEQLAYLYLANNKVSHTAIHTQDFQMFVFSTNLNCAYMMLWIVYLIILFCSDSLTSASWQGEVAVASHTLCASLCL